MVLRGAVDMICVCSRFVTVLLVLCVLAGCQKLFHEDGALLKGKTVSVGMTVPETPAPAVKPLEPERTADNLLKPAPPGSVDIRLLPVQDPAGAVAHRPASAPAAASLPVRSAITRADTQLTERVITEDTVLRGTVLVTGSLVVAPQATLRLEAGTRLRFAAVRDSSQKPRLVVQGRLLCAGTAERPVVLASAYEEARAADWGGVVLLGSEKKNSLEHCRIEGAEVGIEARNAQFSARQLTVARCLNGLAFFDSVVTLNGLDLSRCDVGIVFNDSELELRDVKLWENRVGAQGGRSSIVMHTASLLRNAQEGLLADQCRYRLQGVTATDNRVGIYLKGGDGQVLQGRFSRNREAGLALVATRARVQHSSFSGNGGVGLWSDNARGVAVNNAFNNNEGHNLSVHGQDAPAVLLNWWGSSDERQIAAGIRLSGRTGQLPFAPFLSQRPPLAP